MVYSLYLGSSPAYVRFFLFSISPITVVDNDCPHVPCFGITFLPVNCSFLSAKNLQLNYGLSKGIL